MYGKTRRRLGLSLVVVALALVPTGQAMAASVTAPDSPELSVTGGTLEFGTAPSVPVLPGLTLNGQSQTIAAQMGVWSMKDGTGTAEGWNVNVQGDSGADKSPVFKEYCPSIEAACGPVGYVAGGKALAANSLTLNSTDATFTAQAGTTGAAPTHACASACNLDSSTAVKVASAAAEEGTGSYEAGGYGAESVSLSAPTTVRALGAGKVYQVDLIWTLASGPS
jgi:hypothetical protein